VTTVSVALATYNGARYVGEQVRSILAEAPAELVVADDGSTDDTLALVRAIAAHHPVTSLVVLGPEARPLGVAGNFARAVAATHGDLVALSDQDDRWHEGRLAALRARFEAEPDVLLIHHDAALIDGSGQPIGSTLLEWLRVGVGERRLLTSADAFAASIRRNTATGATVVFRRELAEIAGPIGEGWIHDEWWAILAGALGAARLDERALIDYRQHDANEIGVARPTPAYLVRRMLAPRGDRYGWLARRSAALVDRLEALRAQGTVIDERWLALARRKAEFERSRAEYPASRLARVRPVWRNRRQYADLSSQGRLDIVRDLMHGA
jgi:glycosyltransferase involved in cell wall biosynthesis